MSSEGSGTGSHSDLPTPSRLGASKTRPRGIDGRPIFIQAMWRTGSTYIWKKFREQPQYRAYYEPLHEALLRTRDQNAAEQTAASVEKLRHPPIDQFYSAEFPFTAAGGVEFFQKPLSYERYCLEEDDEDEALHRYIGNLIAYASRRGQTAALQFNRGLLRMGWLTRHFSPINILVVRRPIDVWKSFLSFESRWFAGALCLVIGQNRWKAPLKYLPEWVEIPSRVCETVDEENALYGPFAIQNGWRLYPSFFDFYLLSTVYGAKYADCILDMDEICSNSAVRKAATDRLRELGISISLEDCSLPCSGVTSPEEREWLAYEDFAKTFLRRTLPANLLVPHEKIAASHPLLGDYFRDLLSGFTDQRTSGTPQVPEGAAAGPAGTQAEGIRLFRERQFEASARVLGDALAEAPTSERWSDWATAQSACSRPMLAELGYRQALRLDAKDGEAAGNLGTLLVSLGRSAEALPLLEQAELTARAETLPVISQKAVDARKSLRVKDTHQSAVEFFTQKRFEEAEKLLSEALREVETGQLWNDWATIKLARGKTQEAEKALRRAFSLEPDSPSAAANLGAFLFSLGRREEATSFLERAVANRIDGEERSVVVQLLTKCKESGGSASKTLPRLSIIAGKEPAQAAS